MLLGGKQEMNTISVSIELIEPNPYQPRKHFNEEALSELAESIKAIGIIQPPIVRPAENGTYQLVAGERRLRAAKMAGLTEITVITKEMSEKEMAIATNTENLQREDISILEQAAGIQMMMESLRMTQKQVAEQLGVTQAKVSQWLSLLKLDPELQEMIISGKLNQSIGRIISALPNEFQVILVTRYLSILTAKSAQDIVNLYNTLEKLGDANLHPIQKTETINTRSLKILLQANYVDIFTTVIDVLRHEKEVKLNPKKLPSVGFPLMQFKFDQEIQGHLLQDLMKEYKLNDFGLFDINIKNNVRQEASKLLGEYLLKEKEESNNTEFAVEEMKDEGTGEPYDQLTLSNSKEELSAKEKIKKNNEEWKRQTQEWEQGDSEVQPQKVICPLCDIEILEFDSFEFYKDEKYHGICLQEAQETKCVQCETLIPVEDILSKNYEETEAGKFHTDCYTMITSDYAVLPEEKHKEESSDIDNKNIPSNIVDAEVLKLKKPDVPVLNPKPEKTKSGKIFQIMQEDFKPVHPLSDKCYHCKHFNVEGSTYSERCTKTDGGWVSFHSFDRYEVEGQELFTCSQFTALKEFVTVKKAKNTLNETGMIEALFELLLHQGDPSWIKRYIPELNNKSSITVEETIGFFKTADINTKSYMVEIMYHHFQLEQIKNTNKTLPYITLEGQKVNISSKTLVNAEI